MAGDLQRQAWQWVLATGQRMIRFPAVVRSPATMVVISGGGPLAKRAGAAGELVAESSLRASGVGGRPPSGE